MWHERREPGGGGRGRDLIPHSRRCVAGDALIVLEARPVGALADMAEAASRIRIVIRLGNGRTDQI